MRPIVGIDPGVGGAVAILEPDGKTYCLTVWDLKEFYRKQHGFNCLDASRFAKFVYKEIDRLEDVIILCEQPQIRHTDGIKTARCVYRSDGTMATVFESHGIKFEYVNAKEWKKPFGLSSDKRKSVAKAVNEFPKWKDFFVGPRGGIMHGRAEAALIALYGKNKLKQ